MHCHFCEIAKARKKLLAHDIPFAKDADLFAVPTVGALVPGWSLICPTEHHLNLRTFYGRPHFHKFVTRIASATRAAFGKPVLFEHGAVRCDSETGCGVNHAHLHIVPIPGGLLPLMNRDGRSWKEVSASSLASIPLDQEYLFYSEQVDARDPMGYVCLLSSPSSQYFRRLVAEKIGRGSEFDYKTFPFLGQATATSAELSRRAA